MTQGRRLRFEGWIYNILNDILCIQTDDCSYERVLKDQIKDLAQREKVKIGSFVKVYYNDSDWTYEVEVTE